jgi:predicted DNA-binding transcriptional regulator AlpA
MAIAHTNSPLLNEREVARITGLSLATVRRWRLLGMGPQYLKIGAAVRYDPSDFQSWMSSLPRGGKPLDA